LVKVRIFVQLDIDLEGAQAPPSGYSFSQNFCRDVQHAAGSSLEELARGIACSDRLIRVMDRICLLSSNLAFWAVQLLKEEDASSDGFKLI